MVKNWYWLIGRWFMVHGSIVQWLTVQWLMVQWVQRFDALMVRCSMVHAFTVVMLVVGVGCSLLVNWLLVIGHWSIGPLVHWLFHIGYRSKVKGPSHSGQVHSSMVFVQWSQWCYVFVFMGYGSHGYALQVVMGPMSS